MQENGWVILHMDNYGVKDVEGAARAAEAVMELQSKRENNMKLIIFGDIENWERGVKLVTAYRPDIEIAGLCALDLEDHRDSDATFTLREVIALCQTKQIDGVINL